MTKSSGSAQRFAFRLGLLTAVLVLTGACATGRVPIRTLLDDPGRYDGEDVRVEGRVTESVGALGYGAYRLNDGTGTMNVVTREGGAPSEGAKVGVRGTFRAVYTFGTSSGTAIIEKKRYRP